MYMYMYIHMYMRMRIYIYIYTHLYIYTPALEMTLATLPAAGRCAAFPRRQIQCNTLQHTLKHTLQHTASHCNTHCNIIQHTATHCNTLQHTATHCNTLQQGGAGHDFLHVGRIHVHRVHIALSICVCRSVRVYVCVCKCMCVCMCACVCVCVCVCVCPSWNCIIAFPDNNSYKKKSCDLGGQAGMKESEMSVVFQICRVYYVAHTPQGLIIIPCLSMILCTWNIERLYLSICESMRMVLSGGLNMSLESRCVVESWICCAPEKCTYVGWQPNTVCCVVGFLKRHNVMIQDNIILLNQKKRSDI